MLLVTYLQARELLTIFEADKFDGDAMVKDVSVCPGVLLFDDAYDAQNEEELTQVDFSSFLFRMGFKNGVLRITTVISRY